MTIHLPEELESSIRAEVACGHFASVDDAMAEAARLLLRELKHGHQQHHVSHDDHTSDPLLGCMRDDAELMDEVVADAYRQRREEPWRDVDL
jgi:Arc/MetJ-type ribon-helix-helix transcriptional regulator